MRPILLNRVWNAWFIWRGYKLWNHILSADSINIVPPFCLQPSEFIAQLNHWYESTWLYGHFYFSGLGNLYWVQLLLIFVILHFPSMTFRSQPFRHQSTRHRQCVFWYECLSSAPLTLVSWPFSSGKRRKTELSFRRLVHIRLNKVALITHYEADESMITMNLSDNGWRDCLSAFRSTTSPICTNLTLSALSFSW